MVTLSHASPHLLLDLLLTLVVVHPTVVAAIVVVHPTVVAASVVVPPRCNVVLVCMLLAAECS